MKNAECLALLEWALPRLGLRRRGFRRVSGQVCKRIARRAKALGLSGIADYRQHLERHDEEWQVLDALCRVTISRFFRDRGVFALLSDALLPELALRATERSKQTLRVWSAGCAGGEEPYSVVIAWLASVAEQFPNVALHVVATEADPAQLARARNGVYPRGAFKEVPPAWRAATTRERDGRISIRDEVRAPVELLEQDLRRVMPEGPFDLILCRNLAFSYFAEPLQQQVLEGLLSRLEQGGYLVIGKHERLPSRLPARSERLALTEVAPGSGVFRGQPK